MKIDLEEPFKSIWNNGYIVINPENRRNVILFNSRNDRTTISYARYLMSVHLGYIVPDEYEVDHRDDDKTNDDINNLQLLTKEQNKLKQQYYFTMYEQEHCGFTCPICECHFLMEKRQSHQYIKNNKNPTCGSRVCVSTQKSITLRNK